MAQVTQSPKLRASIEHFLDYVRGQWSSIPATADEWDEWDEESQFVFVCEWGIVEDRFGELRRWAEQGLLTDEQRERYHELRRIVAEQRPLLNQMFGEDTGRLDGAAGGALPELRRDGQG